ncbi:MAG: ParB N-terminal domain-containing protein [Cyclobacteriaceae bacterium]
MLNSEVIIEPKLEDFILPLSAGEFAQLEISILKNGCIDPIVLWKRNEGRDVIVDGHNRFKICKIHGITFETRYVTFENIDDAKSWMIDNQLGRRNLNPEQISFYRGLKYLKLRNKKGGYTSVSKKGQSSLPTTEVLSKQFKVSESTIKRDAKFAEALELIGTSNIKLRNQILCGESKVTKSDVIMLINSDDKDKLVITNEADLSNKARIIQSNMLEEIESNIKSIEKGKLDKAKEAMDVIEPLFLDNVDKIRRIKGMIISAMNRAIDKKEVEAVSELKNLIDKLAEVIFEE